jgi:hypothetical protein
MFTPRPTSCPIATGALRSHPRPTWPFPWIVPRGHHTPDSPAPTGDEAKSLETVAQPAVQESLAQVQSAAVAELAKLNITRFMSNFTAAHAAVETLKDFAAKVDESLRRLNVTEGYATMGHASLPYLLKRIRVEKKVLEAIVSAFGKNATEETGKPEKRNVLRFEDAGIAPTLIASRLHPMTFSTRRGPAIVNPSPSAPSSSNEDPVPFGFGVLPVSLSPALATSASLADRAVVDASTPASSSRRVFRGGQGPVVKSNFLPSPTKALVLGHSPAVAIDSSLLPMLTRQANDREEGGSQPANAPNTQSQGDEVTTPTTFSRSTVARREAGPQTEWTFMKMGRYDVQ